MEIFLSYGVIIIKRILHNYYKFTNENIKPVCLLSMLGGRTRISFKLKTRRDRFIVADTIQM